MYFNFDDNRPDTPRIPRPMSRREVVLIAVNIHALVLIAILLGPRIPWVREMMEQRQKAIEEQMRAQLEQEREREQGAVRLRAAAARQADAQSVAESGSVRSRSPGADRGARAEALQPDAVRAGQLARTPRGHASERAAKAIDAAGATRRRRQRSATLDAPRHGGVPERPPDSTRPTEPGGPAVGVIADAIRNVRKYAQQENFGNLRGGDNQNFGESIQFDTKGVEFGPWLARFLAQVRANWMIPQAAMSMHGHVAITLVVHKDGRITDVAVAKPSAVNAFTLSGRNAILTSNPTIPLPPDTRTTGCRS